MCYGIDKRIKLKKNRIFLRKFKIKRIIYIGIKR